MRIKTLTTSHILINGFSARRGGGQTYLHHLLSHYEHANNQKVSLLIHESSDIDISNENINLIRIRFNVNNPFLRYFWERFYLPKLIRELSVDLLFCPGGLISTNKPRRTKRVTMFRNMIPLDKIQKSQYPYGYMRFRNWLLGYSLVNSMEKADMVIFISELGKKVAEVASKKGISNSVIIPHGVNKLDNRKELQNEIINESYIAYVSTVDVYKAQLEVVIAYKICLDKGYDLPKLLLVGPWETMSYVDKVKRKIDELDLRSKVILTGAVPYNEVFALYKGADFLIYASKSENCPNILLESMACGKAVICSNYDPMPEFADEAVLYFDPMNPKDLSKKIIMLVENLDLKDDLEKKSIAQSDMFSWEKCSKKTWKELFNLIN